MFNFEWITQDYLAARIQLFLPSLLILAALVVGYLIYLKKFPVKDLIPNKDELPPEEPERQAAANAFFWKRKWKFAGSIILAFILGPMKFTLLLFAPLIVLNETLTKQAWGMIFLAATSEGAYTSYFKKIDFLEKEEWIKKGKNVRLAAKSGAKLLAFVSAFGFAIFSGYVGIATQSLWICTLSRTFGAIGLMSIIILIPVILILLAALGFKICHFVADAWDKRSSRYQPRQRY